MLEEFEYSSYWSNTVAYRTTGRIAATGSPTLS